MFQLILIFTVLIILTLLIWIYKTLSKLTVMSEQYWGSVQTQLQRKYDLIGVLSDFIKTNNPDNTDAANELTEAKLKAMQSFTPFQKSMTEKPLDDCIDNVLEISEADEKLINDEKFLKIKQDLNAVKSELVISSNYYNAIIRDYNARITSFPSSLVAGILGHYSKETFDTDLDLQSIDEGIDESIDEGIDESTDDS